MYAVKENDILRRKCPIVIWLIMFSVLKKWIHFWMQCKCPYQFYRPMHISRPNNQEQEIMFKHSESEFAFEFSIK